MKPTPIRAVLDTNVLVSALLFENGRLSWLRSSWQSSQVIPLLAQPTALELLRVLAYPKFKLQPQERDQLLEELLPWCETWRAPLTSSSPTVRDGHDQVFLDLALTARADALVSGDGDLLALKEQVPPLKIFTPAEFQAWLSRGDRRTRDLAVKEALRRRAQRHGRSMEEEVRVILAQAVARDEPSSSHTPGLGSQMAGLFADVGLEEPIREWRGVEPVPAPFEP